MTLKYFRKNEKLFSFLFISLLFSESIYPSVQGINQISVSGAQPVSASVSSLVDPYTGDFHYSVPLVTIPGPNGESVPVTANYHAGIRTDEKASWLGLGWDYNPGEISRQIVGVPDDWNGKLKYNTDYSSTTSHNEAVSCFGSMYTKNINTTNLSTLYSSVNESGYGSNFITTTKLGDYKAVSVPFSKLMRTIEIENSVSGSSSGYNNLMPYRFRKYSFAHQSLAFDNYFVSGPVSGKMEPYFYGLYTVPGELNNNVSSITTTEVSKPMQFYMENTSYLTVNSPSSSNLNATTNRTKSGYFIKYYTNADINNNSNLFNNTTQTGFLDYQFFSNGTTRRPSSTFDPDEIGAYEITDPSGMTYHYSLAVYNTNEIEKIFGNISSGNPEELSCSIKSHAYASSWKLTAITGPDYQDSNNNYTVDQGDTGYWIAYNYSLWASNYLWSSARYNYKDDQYGPYYMTEGRYSAGPYMKNYSPTSFRAKKSMSQGKTDVYYLNYIQTSTHTALFVKSIRKDERSYDDVINPSVKATPLLKLDKIVLLRNEDLGMILTSALPISSSDLDSRFDYTKCSTAQADPAFINVSKYNAYKTTLDPLSLKSVEFVSDYSLCKKYYPNINNTITSTAINFPSYKPVKDAYQYYNGSYLLYALYNKTNFTTSDLSNSGKLTLNSIKFYELTGEKITPSMDFDYGQSDSNKNPDYDMDKYDLWGYYKSDYVSNGSHYTSNTSKSYLDAWSLREITTPLGGKIQIDYEADQYQREGFANDDNSAHKIFNNKPYLIFPISGLTGESIYNPYFSAANYLYADLSSFSGAPNMGSMSVIPRESSCSGSSEKYLVNCHANGLSVSGSSGLALDINICSGSPNYYSYDPNRSYAYGVINYNSLYGGGIRVKSLKVFEPDKNETYKTNYQYTDGYCVAVPKPMDFGNENPSNFGIHINDKLAIEGVPSGVGYSQVTITNESLSGSTNGKVVYHFNNATINHPIHYDITDPNHQKHVKIESISYSISNSKCWDYYQHSGCNLSSVQEKITDYTFRLSLSYDNSELLLLGKVNSVEVNSSNNDLISKTEYVYNETPYLTEGYTFNSSFSTFRDYTPHYVLLSGCTTSGVSGTHTETLSCVAQDDYVVNSHKVDHDIYTSKTITTKDGISISDEILSWDGATALPLKHKVVDPTQGIMITKATPAYYNSTYQALGLKSINETYKNQPTLLENSQSLRLPINANTVGTDETTDPASTFIVSENKNTYTNVYPVRDYLSNQYTSTSVTKNWYRLNETYTRLLDDITAYNSGATPVWRKLSEGTLYDTENNKIEETGLNNRKVASKWGYKNRYQLASISNANYNSFTFSGFEDKFQWNTNVYHFGGEVSGGEFQSVAMVNVSQASSNGSVLKPLPILSQINPHTGSYFVNVPANTDGPEFNARQFEIGRTYIAKVWVHKASASDAKLVMELTGQTLSNGVYTNVNQSSEVSIGNSNNVTVGDWILMSTEINVPDNFYLPSTHNLRVYVKNASTSGAAYFDDFSFHPKDATLSGNVYDSRTGLLIAQLDNENFATLFNYDHAGRVISTYVEYSGGIKKVSENQYHFVKP